MCMRYLGVFFLLVAILSTGSCKAVTTTVAERCVLLDLPVQRGSELLPMLEEFALKNELDVDLSNPAVARYTRGERLRPSSYLGYTMGMGDFGAVLSLFRFERPQDADLLDSFDRFVEDEVAPRYRVTLCSEVPDFQPPVVYR